MTSKATYEDAVLTDAAWADPALADAGLTGAVWTAALLTDAAASTSASASMGPSTSTDAASTNATSTTRAVLLDEGLANAGTDMISTKATLADAAFTDLPSAGDDLREPVHRGTVSTYVVVQTTTGAANSTDMPII